MPCKRASEFDLEVLFREPDSPECREFVAHSDGCEDCAAAIAAGGTARSPESSRTPAVAVTGAAIVVVAVVALLALPDRSRDADDPTKAAVAHQPAIVVESAPAPKGSPTPPAAAVEAIDSVTLELGEERIVAAAALPKGRPFGLSLRVPPVDDGVEALKITLIADDGRVLRMSGVIDAGDRELASASVEADWLNEPGRYIVDVVTTEKSHFPLRRYVIEVR